MSQVAQRFVELPKARQALVEQLLQKEGFDISLLPLRRRAAGLTELPLAHGQESLWFMGHLAADNAVYNLPSAIRLTGRLDRAALERAIGEIVRRHEILRTRFPAASGRPLQEILPEHRFELSVVVCAGSSEQERLAHALRLANAESVRPFDLAGSPPWRLFLYEIGPEDHLLLSVFHHIIWDGWSIGVWSHELAALYGAFSQGRSTSLPELPIQFADYALFQREWLSGDRLAALVAYWQKQLEGIAPLALPTDRPRPALPTFAGSELPFELPAELSTAVEELSHRAGTTLFMPLLAAFQALLHRYTQQERFAVGTPVANRRRREIEGLLGCFANITVMATELSGDLTFAELLSRTKEVATGAYAHQDIPFDLLVDKLRVERDANRNPLFQVMFALHQERMDTLELPGLQVKHAELEGGHSHFDLGLHLWRYPDGIRGCISYNKDLFDPSTIQRMIGHYQQLLSAAVRAPDQKLSALPLLTREEWRDLRSWNPSDPARTVPVDPVARFEEHAAASPERTALVWQEGDTVRRLTFGALQERVTRLARYLRLERPGRWGICLDSGPDEVVALLAALGSGSAFVPLAPEFSATQHARVLMDAGVKRVLTHRRLAEPFVSLGFEPLCLDEPLPSQPPGDETSAAVPGELAYLSYTSGRSHPVTRSALGLRLARLEQRIPLAPGETLLATAPPGRDFFVVELLWPLSCAATIVLGDAAARSPPSLPSWEHPPEVAHLTPEQLATLLKPEHAEVLARLGTPRVVLCGGSAPRPGLAEAFHARLSSRLLYLYAPPEADAEVGLFELPSRQQRGAPPTGRPELLPTWVLDQCGQPTPVGIPGRVHVGITPAPAETQAVPEELVATEDRGVRLADGTLHLLGSSPRTVWYEGLRIHLPDVAALLLSHPAVEAAHVLSRSCDGVDQLVAYVVPCTPVARLHLEKHVRPHLPAPGLPLSIVLIRSLPLTQGGRVDERALVTLPVLDESLVTVWESKLAEVPGVTRVKVLACEPPEPQALLHISELLPDLRPRRAIERHTTTASGHVPQEGSATVRLAHARGAPLSIPEGAPRTLTEALLRAAETWRDRGLTLVQGSEKTTFLSYPELLHRARCILAGLRARGLRAGDRAILQIESFDDHFPAFWACVLGGILPVTVATASTYERKNAVLGKLFNVWELLGHPVLIASRQWVKPLEGVPALYRDGGSGPPFQALAVDELAAHPPAAELHPARPEDVAFLQLSSGSTGTPKCVQETHAGVIHHVHGVQLHNGYGPDDVDLNWLPMDHVVSIITSHLKSLYLGNSQLHVRTELILAAPLTWLDLMERYRVTHGFAPNFAFRLVNDALARSPSQRWSLTSLQRLINGGEQVTLPVVEEFLRRTAPFGLAPGVIQPAFGMAESCTGVTYANDWTPAEGTFRVRKSSLQGVLEKAAPEEEGLTFVDLGPVRPGIEIRITGPEGQILPECVIGVMQLRGGSVTPGYLLNEEANREALVGDGWFSTGDLGFLRNGRLSITGRRKEMLNIRGANLYCYELEDAVGALEGVEPTFVAACAVDDPDTGTEALALFFVPRAPELDVALLRAIREKVSEGFGVSPTYVLPIAREDFPKTTSGKIQRTQLKQELLAGRFDGLLARIDLALGNEHTIPAWFHRPVWQPQERIAVSGRRPSGPSLVLCGEESLGRSLCERLGEQAVRVEPGTAFTRMGPRAFTLDPRDPSHCSALLETLASEGLWPQQVFLRWTHGTPGAEPQSVSELLAAHESASGGLLSLAQALVRPPAGATPPQLLVIASHTRAGAPGDRIATERASLRGLVKALAQEWPALACRHIDVPPHELTAHIELLLEEAACPTKDREILYRDGRRYVLRLDAVKPQPTRELPWKRGDLVLLSGGLGGIGTELARFLLEQGVRLLLVGRTPLQEGGERPEQEDALGQQRSVEERRKALQALEQAGTVLYEVADVTDLARMREVVSRAEQRLGTKLAGAIHLAGVFPTRLLAEETPRSLTETVAPKLAGAWVLRRLVGEEGFLITFGSAYALFGGVAVGAYTAAACALEAFHEEEHRQGLARSYHFAFTHWEELGLSRGYQLAEQSLARGYRMISKGQGITSLLAGLRSGQTEWVVGLDERKPHVRRYLRAPAAPAEQLMAWATPQEISVPAWIQAAPLVDRFGTPAPCKCMTVPSLPLTASGEVDGVALRGMGTARTASAVERVLPRTSLERSIAAIWREVLQVDAVDVNTSFFALGGQSVLLVQVLGKVRSLVGRELSVVDLFRHPTIGSLARHLEQGEAAPKRSLQKVEARAQKQREAARQRIATRGHPGPGGKRSP